MKKKIALIFGVSGQDGAYLANFLIKKNYLVIGVTRNPTNSNLFRLNMLNIKKQIKIFKNDKINFNFLKKIYHKYHMIDEIYFLSGVSSPRKSLEIPIQTFNSNTINLLKLLEFLKKTKNKSKLFYASSSEIFKKNKKNIFNEKSELGATSPYAISKVAGTLLVKNYREQYNLFSCSGILFNHESPLRSKNFVLKKIVIELKNIKKNGGILKLGNINIRRDIGWAPEYVKAMRKMLQIKKPIDIIIGSGKMFSVKLFLDIIIKKLKIDKKSIVLNNQNLLRKFEIKAYKSEPRLAKKKLGWKTNISLEQIARKLLNDELF